jgi:hypothetical protein
MKIRTIIIILMAINDHERMIREETVAIIIIMRILLPVENKLSE